jgi:cysteinyl-tRNA synthetase
MRCWRYFIIYGVAIPRAQTAWITFEPSRKGSCRQLLITLKPRATLFQSSSATQSEQFETIFDKIETIFDQIDHFNQTTEGEISEYYRRDPRDLSHIADKPGLRELLAQRAEDRRTRDYKSVDRIDLLLKQKHGVRAFDNPGVWTRHHNAPDSYLLRRGRKKVAKMKEQFGPTGHPYSQIGDGIDSLVCPLSVTQIHSLLSRRYRCRLESHDEEANTMRFELLINGVQLDDQLEQWRADGKNTFRETKVYSKDQHQFAESYAENEASSHTYTKIESYTVRRVEQLVEMRSDAIARGEVDLTDFLSYELYKTYNVSVEDQTRTWSFEGKFSGNVAWSPPNLPNVTEQLGNTIFPPTLFPDTDQKYASPGYQQSINSQKPPNEASRRIEQLVQERMYKREELKFLEADAMRKELWETYRVGVNDRLRQWSVASIMQNEAGPKRTYYTQSARSESLSLNLQGEVDSLLRYLESTRKSQNNNTAAGILKRLQKYYAVVVDEERMEWSVEAATEAN